MVAIVSDDALSSLRVLQTVIGGRQVFLATGEG